MVPESQDDDSQGGILFITHFFNGQVTVVDLETLSVRAEVPTGVGTNLTQFIVVEPDGAKAYLPQIRANATVTVLVSDSASLKAVM